MQNQRVSQSPPTSTASRKEQLILDHLYLVRPIATSIWAKIPVHIETEDLIHDGVCGLVDVAKRYDPRRKVPFALFAKHRIRGSILDGLRRLDPASRDLRAKACCTTGTAPQCGKLAVSSESTKAESRKSTNTRWSALAVALRSAGIASSNSILLR
jgi:RNA polymerase sigma factor for flagellar operon FliA